MPSPDSLPAPAASLEAGLGAWHGFHREVLDRMSGLALALDRHDRPEVERACRWLHGRLDAHLRWEEQELYPRLEPAGATELRAALQADHREMLRLAGLALEAGPPGDAHHPTEPARRLLDLVRHHIDTEKHRVLPLVEGRRPYEPPAGAGYHTPPRWPG
jgi:hemerythrin-like domain-containing protein